MACHTRDLFRGGLNPGTPGIMSPNSTDDHGKHEPAVVGHEDQHEHEGETHLETVPAALVEVGPSAVSGCDVVGERTTI